MDRGIEIRIKRIARAGALAVLAIAAEGIPCRAQAVAAAVAEADAYEHSPDILRGLMKEWREAKDAEAKRTIFQKIFAEVPHLRETDESEGREALREIAAGGPAAEKRIKPEGTAKEIRLKPVKVFSEIQDPVADRGSAWQARRIAKDAIEVWTSKEGWLFDGKGDLKNHASVPRRDGTGLEWFGAFRPDGAWVTTDLWSYDKTLFLFSKEGKFIRDAGNNGELIGWARADRDGKGWVAGTAGSAFGSFWVDDAMKPQMLGGTQAWERCYPRQLGVRYWCCPSDDGKLLLRGSEAGHGPYVGLPTYGLETNAGDAGDPKPFFTACLPGHASNLGFWPGSDRIFIDDGSEWNRRPTQTWFFDGTGKFLGWTEAKRLADDAEGSGMLFKIPSDKSILDLGPDMKIREVQKYAGQDGKPADPQAIFDDLKMGLFIEDGKLALESW